jgi:hypothetical protein
MDNRNTAVLINRVLVFAAGLLAGGIIGYMIAQSETAPIPARAALQSVAQLNDVLAVEDVWIVEGFSCPMPGCTQPLLTCQDALARQIRDWVNSQRATGRTGESIRGEIVQTHGAALNKLPPDSR